MAAHAERSARVAPLGVEFRVIDAADVAAAFAPGSFDLVGSCLALQDMPEPAAALRAAHAVLRPGGRCVASITHPCTDTPLRRWERDEAGRKRWLCIDRYFERGAIEYTWRGWEYDFATPAVHATLEDWIGWCLDAGFALRGLHEPRPTEEALRERPDLEDAARVPYYAILDLAREG
jgi:SAM-dependent methyltransferase